MQSKVEQLYQAFEATKAELDKTKPQFDNEKSTFALHLLGILFHVCNYPFQIIPLHFPIQLRRIEEAHVKIKKSEKENQDWIVTSTKCKEETLKMVTLMATNDKTQKLTIADFETTTESLKTRVESTKSESDDQIKM